LRMDAAAQAARSTEKFQNSYTSGPNREAAQCPKLHTLLPLRV
jgi:hypothetical protein